MADARHVYAAMPEVTGALRKAPLGATGPTDGSTALDAAFVDMGYIGEEGFTESNSRDTDKKKAFGGTTVKVLQTDYTSTVSFSFMESTNAEVLRSVFGADNVTVSGDEIEVRKTKMPLERAQWVVETIDGDAKRRSYIPNGQITEVDDVQLVHTDTISYSVTIECFESPDHEGANVIEWVTPSVTPVADGG